MDVTGDLLNIAEISAAFAGFAALVSVLRQRGTRAEALHDILRLRIVISTSMVVVVAALIPVGLTMFHLPERLVWGISAVILPGSICVCALCRFRVQRQRSMNLRRKRAGTIWKLNDGASIHGHPVPTVIAPSNNPLIYISAVFT